MDISKERTQSQLIEMIDYSRKLAGEYGLKRILMGTDDKKYFLVNDEEESIGFLQFEINGAEGEFDLGLVKEAQGKGLGKRRLETAIHFLMEKNALT